MTAQRNVCTNCERPNQLIHTHDGLCGACYQAQKNLRGEDREAVLRDRKLKYTLPAMEYKPNKLSSKKLPITKSTEQINNSIFSEWAI